jgi:hypothetical protein
MKHVKYVLMILAGAMFSEVSYGQKLPGLDPSPSDIAYFRPDGKKATPLIKVTYGRPQKKGRTMLGGTDPFGQVWRLGANEATEIKLYKDVTFGDKKLSAGTYTIYAIPEKDKWTIIFNTKLDTWGAYDYEKEKDVARIEVPTEKTASEVEAFTIAFAGENGSGNMVMAWEDTQVKVPFKY